jgi:V8-like Glu-specific endopeptidase
MTTRIYGSYFSFSWFVLASFVLLCSSLSYVTAQYVREAIVGGSTVTNAYSFLAFSSGSELCGATLIWSDILLSAGHCVDAFLNSGVFIGGLQLSGADGEYHQVELVLVHPDYPVGTTQPNDIMVFKIATSSFLQPVTLATDTDLPAEGFTVTVVGYGNTEYGSVSQLAKQVDLTVVNLTACDELYGGKVIEAQFCTDGNGDSCQGDSGGPLLSSNGEQVGIVSFGEGCDEYPSVNTRVSSYSAWIQEGICSLSSSPPSGCATVSAPTISTSAPIPALTSTPTFLPIPFLTAAPVVTTPAPVTGYPVITPSPTITRSNPPSDSPSIIPTMIPSVTTVVETTSPTIVALAANETAASSGAPTRPPAPLESAEERPPPVGDDPSSFRAPSSAAKSWIPSAQWPPAIFLLGMMVPSLAMAHIFCIPFP